MKSAFVTGADYGLGLSLTKLLLERGYYVVAGQYDQEIKGLTSLQNSYGNQLFCIPLDVSSDDSVNKAALKIKSQIKSLDLLFNNAGILGDIQKTILEKLDFDEMLKVINVNAIGPIRVINALVEEISLGKLKTIINITSEAGSISQNERSAWFGYCMSKAALNMGGNLVQKGLVDKKIHVLQIHPGWVKTYMEGHYNQAADLEADDAAERIIQVVEQQFEKPVKDKPDYIDNVGNALPW